VTAPGGAAAEPKSGLLTHWHTAILTGDSHILLADWITWLTLSRTPMYSKRLDPTITHHVRDGVLVEPDLWPKEQCPQIYVAYDDEGAVYVGQSCQVLGARLKQHFGNQSTPAQQFKAGSWRTIVSATWDELQHGRLDQLEAAAAQWVLPKSHRAGRRHPR